MRRVKSFDATHFKVCRACAPRKADVEYGTQKPSPSALADLSSNGLAVDRSGGSPKRIQQPGIGGGDTGNRIGASRRGFDLE